MTLYIILLIIVVLLLGAKASKMQGRWKRRTWQRSEYPYEQDYPQDNTDPYNAQIDYTTCYQPKYLLTKNEWYAFKKLYEEADKKGLIVCPKVRLLDLIEPKQGIPHYKGAMWKVQSKHVDFLICDKDARVKAVVELDDSSHNRQDRIERDLFVDQVLTNNGYRVIRAHYITEETLSGL